MNITGLFRTSLQVCASMTGGDLICQWLEDRSKTDSSKKSNFFQDKVWDRERTKRMSIVGWFV